MRTGSALFQEGGNAVAARRATTSPTAVMPTVFTRVCIPPNIFRIVNRDYINWLELQRRREHLGAVAQIDQNG